MYLLLTQLTVHFNECLFVYTPPLPLLHVLALQFDSLGSIEYDIAVLHMNGVGLETLQSQ